MINSSFTKKVVVNYFVYSKGYTVERAIRLYDYNKQAFDKVFDLLGENFCIEVLKKIGELWKEDGHKDDEQN
jgi:hypothetical protein